MKKVLIIEDNDKNLYLVQFILEQLGHQYIVARDGATGVNMALQESPDLILMDIQLPVMDGYTATQKIRSHEKGRNLPIIAITSYAMVGDKEKALEAGCSAYIEKPIDPESFIDQLKQYI